MRPDIDTLIVEVEQRPEAVTEAILLRSITASDVGVDFHYVYFGISIASSG